MKVAFYKNSKSFFWKAIRIKQKYIQKLSWRYSRFSHVELVFSDGMSFSSSEQDHWVRFKKIDFKVENWEFIDLNISIKQEQLIREWCEKKIWSDYNWWWIFFAMIFKFYTTWEDDYFCSQICIRALQVTHICCILAAQMTTPWHFAKYLEDEGYKLEEKVLYET